MEPIVVYYLHYQDPEFRKPNWSRKGNYVACVMANNIKHAIKKVRAMETGWIKIMGISTGKPEWVDETNALDVVKPKKISI